MKARPPSTHSSRRMVAIAGSISMALSISLGGMSDLGAAPQAPSIDVVRAQNVDYISAEAALALDLGFPVLVPSWVPSPFGGPPAIDAGGGYYGLYWMNVGGDPTFLHITGQVGGGLPAGSPYDLNNELFINASVMGHDAIHDVTPAYDAVWWIAGGVLYKVESRNSGTDSLSLANSLIAFQGPSLPAPEPTVAPEPTFALEPTVAPEPTDPPAPVPTQAPDGENPDEAPQSDNPATIVPTAEPTSEAVDPGPDVVVDSDGEVQTETVPGDDTTAGDPAIAEVGGTLTTDGTGQSTVSSDGTGGPDVPAIDGDGTGGAADVYVPRRSSGTQIP